jgi:predicted NBD/HSP70 family sugar kinase
MFYLITVDIGGTFTKLALVSSNGHLAEKMERATPASCNEFIQIVEEYYEKNPEIYNIKGISISSPGSVTEEGNVLGYSSVPFIHEENMKRLLEKRFKLPVTMEYDANCAALAEMWNGAARNLETYACIVCGTGIGGSIIINRKLYKGAHLHGGEFGYAILNSNEEADHYDSWSDLGSSSAIIRRLQNEAPYFEEWTGPLAFQHAEKNNKNAVKSIDLFFRTLAVGIFNIQYMLDPEKILIGGGITRQPAFMEKLNFHLNTIYDAKPFAQVRSSVSLCQHLDQAQLFGAAHVWLEKYKKGESHDV